MSDAADSHALLLDVPVHDPIPDPIPRLLGWVCAATGCQGTGTAVPGSFARRRDRRKGRVQAVVSGVYFANHDHF